MKKIVFGILGVLVIAGLVLGLASCSKNASAQGTANTVKTTTGGTYAPTTIKPTISGDNITIPATAVNTSKNVEFDVNFTEGTASYIAYVYNGAIQVRASFCVPCRGRSFTLKGNYLICNNCGTVFSAQTGKGVSGVPACQSYPKAAVSFTADANGNLVMQKSALLTAFTDTLEPGLP